MPMYEYECLKCRRRTERIENHSGPHLRKCPYCAGKVERLISRSAIQFKGSGWYVSDYQRKGSGGDGTGEKKAESKPETKSEAKTESKSETKTKTETKSETKTETRSDSKGAKEKK